MSLKQIHLAKNRVLDFHWQLAFIVSKIESHGALMTIGDVLEGMKYGVY